MKKILTFISVAIFSAWMIVEGQDIAQVKNSELDSIGIGGHRHYQLDSVRFLYPLVGGSYGNPQILGAVTVNIQTNSISGRTDSLYVWARPVHLLRGSYVVATDDSIMLYSLLDYDSGDVYAFELTTPFGPAYGLEVYADWRGLVLEDSTGADRDSIKILTWLTFQ